MNGDRIVWDRERGGEAVAGPIRVTLPAMQIPDIGCASWRGLAVHAIDYRPGEAYRIRLHSCDVRDMLPAEMQCCADWLARLDRRFMATGEGV